MIVKGRVIERHPELTVEDVEYAWEHFREATIREVTLREMRIGFDKRGRLLEMVGVLTMDGWVIYHAMTTPSKKTLNEIEKAKDSR